MVELKKEIEAVEKLGAATQVIDMALRARTGIHVSSLNYDAIAGLVMMRNKGLVIYRDGKFNDVSVDSEQAWYMNVSPRLNTEMRMRLTRKFYDTLSVYPPALMATAINISSVYQEVKNELNSIHDFNLADPNVLELFCMRDLQLIIAMIYNCIEDRHVICRRGEYEGCRYSSVPVYDGQHWEELTLDSKTIISLLSLQGVKSSKLTTRKLKVYVNVPN